MVVGRRFCPQQGFHGFVPVVPRLVHGFSDGVQIDDGAPETADGLAFRNAVLRDLAAQGGDLRFCLLRGGPGLG
jgi:hypothetical protein